ncbi:LIM and calponin homology domains-containing protein 1a isoform X2 [Trichomycterus rosablanca]|uniref:LIM and calponin homology domains-containing protein 1a isoform X2 n=1 Tax=Trichomycterus rosablanca TaxID=2290929 RepID=UPI002F353516
MASADQPEPTEVNPAQAFLEAQKWIEAVTGKTFGERDFRSSLENGVLLCELLSSIKPGLVKKINRLQTPIAGLDNLTVFLRGCEELGLKGSQLFDPGDLQDMSIRANLTGSECSRKLKNVLITLYWLGKTANVCEAYSGPTLDLKEFEGLLSMTRKDCINEESDSPKRSVRDSGCVDNWESEHSDSLSPPRHQREDSFDSLDSVGSHCQYGQTADAVIRANNDDEDGEQRRPDVRKDDMSARRVSCKEPRAVLPFNQYLPNKSNQTNYVPAPLRKRRSERDEELRSASNSTSPISESSKAGGAEPEPDEAELNRMRKLEKAGIKVLPALARYNSPKVIREEPEQVESPPPDIILRRDNNFLRADRAHEWDGEDDEDGDGDRKVPDIQNDDLASRRARMNQPKPNAVHRFLPSACSEKDRERWEGIRLSSQHAVLESVEKIKQEKSEANPTPSTVSILTRKDNPFLNPRTKKNRSEEEKRNENEEEEDDDEKEVVPNLKTDDLARRRSQSRSHLRKDPRRALTQTSMTESDLKKWQRLSMSTEDSEFPPVEVSIVARKDNTFPTPEKPREQLGRHDDDHEETNGGARAASPNVEKDDLARRQAQSGHHPHPRQPLAQTAITRSDLEKWQKLQMSTDDSEAVSAPTAPAESPRPSARDPGRPLSSAEREALELRLAEKARDEEDEEEDEEEKGRQPDLEKDDMMARRTGAFQKGTGGGSHSRFLPLPGAKKETGSDKHGRGASGDPAMLEKTIQTKRFKVGQRVPPKEAPPSAPERPDVFGSARDSDPAPDKDDMLARRTGAHQKPSGGPGQTFNAFLPVPGAARGKKNPEQKQESNHACALGPALRSATPPPAEVDDAPRNILGTTQRSSPLPHPDAQPAQCCPGDDDAFPSKSVSLIDMRDEEDVDSLSPHSQARHERLHNQYNQNKEEDDHWRDDLARWKNRRRSASQDLIKKEEERKMTEKLLMSEVFSQRKKSIKTYKEIVEEKERREQELHTMYSNASTAEEKAAILQRYALRFTISDAILEKLQLPKLPAAIAEQVAYTLKEEAELLEAQAPSDWQSPLDTSDLSPLYHQDSRTSEVQLLPNQASETPELPLSPAREPQTPKVPLSPAREPQTPKVPLLPAREPQTPEVPLSSPTAQTCKIQEVPNSPSKESKTSEVLPLPAQEPQISEVPKSPSQKSKSSEVLPLPAQEPQISEVPLSSPTVQTCRIQVPNLPSQESKTSEVLPSPTPEIPLSPARALTSPAIPSSSTQASKTPEILPLPTRISPAPYRPVPLLTPKPYSQPKLNQLSYKQFKSDGLVRVNGDSTSEETRVSPVRPVSFCPVPTKWANESPQRGPEIAPETQATSIVVKKEMQSLSSCEEKSTTVEETSKPLPASELTGNQTVSDSAVKRSCVVKTTIVTEVTGTHLLATRDLAGSDQTKSLNGSSQNELASSYSPSLTDGFDLTSECIETPMLNLAKRVDHWTWDPNEERKRQERWQQEQERLLQEKYQREQERLKQEWEKAQKEVEEEERKHHEEEQKILEETVAPLTPHSSGLSSSGSVTDASPTGTSHDTIVLSLADWERKQEMLEKQVKSDGTSSNWTEEIEPTQQNGQQAEHQEGQTATPRLQFIQDETWSCKPEHTHELNKTASLDRNAGLPQDQAPKMRRSGSYEHVLGCTSVICPSSQDASASTDRSISAKKLCSSCTEPLGKGAAMIIESLGLYFHIQCFKCGVCRGLLGDTSSGTDVRIRTGVLNCHECYLKSRAAGQPTVL